MGDNASGRVAGKKALITGAGQGLGACFARMLAAEGAKVTLTDIQGDNARARAAEINEKYPGRASAHTHDVTKKEDWERVLVEAERDMGGLSVLINNAGIGSAGTIETESMAGWRRVFDINVDAAFVGTQLAMPYLKRSQPASIIMVSSIASMKADAWMLAYNASKAAIAMMAKSIALHCTRERLDIRCNSLHPVFTRTPIVDPIIAMGGGGQEGERKLVKHIPMRRMGEPEEIGYAVLYLASDESSFVTGTEMKVDGGITA